MERKLTAILIADMVGYSRMMEADERGTIERTRRYLDTVIQPRVDQCGGRITGTSGDAFVAIFDSVGEAVDCAIDIQRSITASELGQRDDQRICFRMGINLGDVYHADGDVSGDGVNIAARLEQLAEPGAICISGSAYDQLRDLPDVAFTDMGETSVKNITRPIRVWQLNLDKAAAPVGRQRGVPRRWLVAGLGLAALVVLALAGVNWFGRAADPPLPPIAAASTKPSVLVLPFDNLSGDASQDYFSDGLSDNLITDLSTVHELLVIARNTSFSFRDRGEPTDARSVNAALGVDYVVDGSVQKLADQVRVNVSLVDAVQGTQVWGARLDRDISELFTLQDEVAQKIIEALEVELTQAERRQIAKRYTDSIDAYDLYLRAWEEIWRFNPESRLRAQALLRRAVELDPNFALALGILATSYTNRIGADLSNNEQRLDIAHSLAERAVKLDPELASVQSSLGLVHMFRREYEEADAAFQRAVDLDPNYADAFAMQGWNRHYDGDAAAALKGFQYALMLNPRAPFPYLNAIAETYFMLGDFERSIEYNLRGLERNPEALRQRLFLAAAYAATGQIDEAEWQVEEALILQPDFTLDSMRLIAPYRRAEDMDRVLDALRLAGLPEG